MGWRRRTAHSKRRQLISIGAWYVSLQREDCPPQMHGWTEGVARGVLGVVHVNEPPVTTPFSFVVIYSVERRGSYQPTWRILSPLHFATPSLHWIIPRVLWRDLPTNIRAAIRSIQWMKSDGGCRVLDHFMAVTRDEINKTRILYKIFIYKSLSIFLILLWNKDWFNIIVTPNIYF